VLVSSSCFKHGVVWAAVLGREKVVWLVFNEGAD